MSVLDGLRRRTQTLIKDDDPYSGQCGDTKMKVSVAVLEGGRSSRFGSPKTEAWLLGRTLIEWACDLAACLSDDVMIAGTGVSRPLHHPVRYIADIHRDCGPLGGIHSALLHSKQDWLAVIPTDMPMLNGQIYEQLWENRQTHRVVAVRVAWGPVPIVSLWHKSLIFQVEQCLLSGEWALFRVQQKLGARWVDITYGNTEEEELIFANVNTPSDLMRIQYYLEGRDGRTGVGRGHYRPPYMEGMSNETAGTRINR